MLITQKNILRHLTKEQFNLLSLLCHYSKNVYNCGLFNIRQYWEMFNEYFNYQDNCHTMKTNENYQMNLVQTSQQILKVLERNMKSYFHILREKKKGNYNRPLELPHFLKKDGHFLLIFTKQNSRLRNGFFEFNLTKAFRDKHHPSFKTFQIRLPPFVTAENIHEVRILPHLTYFEIEYVYDKNIEPISINKAKVLGIDINLDNLAVCVDCTNGHSFILDGRNLKSYNHWYNKHVAQYQSNINQQGISHRTKYLQHLDQHRKWYINNYMNQVVNQIVRYCINNQIGTIVVGQNKEWKQDYNKGSRNNQNFVMIPHGLMLAKLKSKCDQYTIDYISQEESYTSKCSFLDQEELGHHDEYVGERIERGLFQTKSMQLINADVNGALNIVKKSKQNISLTDKLCSGLMLSPKRIIIIKST